MERTGNDSPSFALSRNCLFRLGFVFLFCFVFVCLPSLGAGGGGGGGGGGGRRALVPLKTI